MKMSLRKWFWLRIAIGAGVAVYSFGGKLIVYLTGLRDQGGGWSDVDGISVALFGLLMLGDILVVLGTLLAKITPEDPPTEAELEALASAPDLAPARRR